MSYFKERDENVQKRIDRVMAELPDFCKRFKRYADDKLTKLTECGYLYTLRQFFKYIGEIRGTNYMKFTVDDLNTVTTAEVEDWLDSFKGVTAKNDRTRKQITLNTFLGYYNSLELLNRIVTRPLPIKKLDEKPIERLRVEQVADLLHAIEDAGLKYKQRDKTIIAFMVYTGVRISELIGLDIGHVDLTRKSFSITRKGGKKTQTLFLPPELLTQLYIYIQTINTSNKSEPLFKSKINKRMADISIREMLTKYVKLAGISQRITPHVLRKTFGTSLYRQERDIFLVADILGHDSVVTTRKHYALVDDDIKSEAMFRYSAYNKNNDNPNHNIAREKAKEHRSQQKQNSYTSPRYA